MTFVNGVVDITTAIATFAAVVVALFGDWIRDRIFAPKLNVSIADAAGDLTQLQNGMTVVVYHVLVSVEDPTKPAEQCEARLVEIEKATEHGLFAQLPLPVSQQLAWAPRELSPLAITVRTTQILDFGMLSPFQHYRGGAHLFEPWLVGFPNNFRGQLSQGERFRYVVEFTAKRLRSPMRCKIEVQWIGDWSEDPKERAKAIRVRKVS